MEKVTLKPLLHRGNDCIGIYFPKNNALQSLVQHQAGAKWSRTHTCWYVPMNKENYERLCVALNGKVMIENESLKTFLIARKEKPIQVSPPSSQHATPQKTTTVQSPKGTPITCEENINALQKFRQMLVLKGYSSSTARTYTNEFIQFLNTIKNKPAATMTEQRVKDYLEFCNKTLKLSEATIHSRMNALKFYYEQILKREKFFWKIPRPKKAHPLPKTFNQDEIAAIINSIKNIKHKAMLMLAYSAGLRVSEVVALKTYQIDSSRMTVFISNTKGKKDRVVSLSPVLLVILREYAQQYKPDRKGYLFEGAEPGAPYSKRSLQEVLADAKRKAGVLKPGSIHSLRHSFATHLIEKGTDVTMIQKLLGHNDIKTTLIYLHTSNKDLLKVVSPLDDLKLK